MIVNKYVKTNCPVYNIYTIFVAKVKKYLRNFFLNLKSTFKSCLKFYAYSISGSRFPRYSSAFRITLGLK